MLSSCGWQKVPSKPVKVLSFGQILYHCLCFTAQGGGHGIATKIVKLQLRFTESSSHHETRTPTWSLTLSFAPLISIIRMVGC